MVDDEDEALAMPDDEAHRRAWEKWDAMACAISQPQLQAQRFKVLHEAAVEDVRTARQALLDVFEELEEARKAMRSMPSPASRSTPTSCRLRRPPGASCIPW
jgi:hypothetical protein